jgi:hypothetical protein
MKKEFEDEDDEELWLIDLREEQEQQ